MTPNATTTRPKNPQNTLTTVPRVLRRLSRSGRRSPAAVLGILKDNSPPGLLPVNVVEGLRELVKETLGVVTSDTCMSMLFENMFTRFVVQDKRHTLPANVTRALRVHYTGRPD